MRLLGGGDHYLLVNYLKYWATTAAPAHSHVSITWIAVHPNPAMDPFIFYVQLIETRACGMSESSPTRRKCVTVYPRIRVSAEKKTLYTVHCLHCTGHVQCHWGKGV